VHPREHRLKACNAVRGSALIGQEGVAEGRAAGTRARESGADPVAVRARRRIGDHQESAETAHRQVVSTPG
jgi:hypothetical protein